jgi:hypothetical protein
MIRAALLLALLATPTFAHEPPGGPDFALYDPDPNHLWNRLHRTLFMRGPMGGEYFGHDDFELLYWQQTQHLLSGPSHDAAVAVLDEFLESDPANAFEDPLKYALLQRDLWGLFDEIYPGPYGLRRFDSETRERYEALLNRLARAIHLVALNREQIEGLPNNYEAAVKSQRFAGTDSPGDWMPFLPPDLLDDDSSWVRIISNERFGPREHRAHTHGQKLFWTFLRVPGGRAETMAYIDELRKYKDEYVPIGWAPDGTPSEFRIVVSTDGPTELPLGTEVALVQQTMLVDKNLKIVPTNIVECVQIRVYDETEPHDESDDPFGFRRRNTVYQRPFEFRLSRSALLQRAAGGLKPIDRNTKRFSTFRAFAGLDGFESQPSGIPFSSYHLRLNRCGLCHSGPGLSSFRAVTQIIGRWNGHGVDHPLDWDHPTTRADETRDAIRIKLEKYSWMALIHRIRSQ